MKKEIQNQIFNLINGIESSEQAKKHFLQVMTIIYGQNSKAYNDFQELIATPEKQLEMLRAPESHKYKRNFMVFCHIVVKDYIEQALSESAKDSAGFLPYGYFAEIEKASQHESDLFKCRTALNTEENALTRLLLSQLAEGCFTAADYRKILSVWLMYPELIYDQDKVAEVIQHLGSAKSL